MRHPSPLLVLLPILALSACSGGNAAEPGEGGAKRPEARPPLVRVRPIELRKVRREVRDTAFLEAERRVVLQSKVAGRVAEVLVDEGQVVSRGQLLARLDDREAATTLAQVRIQLEEAKVRRDLASLESEASAGRLQQARIERDMAQAEWKRNSGIDPAIVSPKVLEDSKYALDGAEEAVRVADFNRRKAELEVKTAGNRIDELATKLAETELRLAEHQIVAPFDGTVVRRHVTGGETLGATSPLFDLADLNHLIAWISRPQRELPFVRNAREVLFTTDAHPDVEFTADVDLISPVVDEKTGSFRLRMRVRPADAPRLVAGLFIRARVLTEELREALMVPKAAVLAEGDRSIAFVVRDGKAVKVTLEAGLEERDAIECKNRGDDGMRPEDQVVVSGHEDLKDQTAVEVSKD